MSSAWDENAFNADDPAALLTYEWDNLLGQDFAFSVAFVEESADVMASTDRIIKLIEAELNSPGRDSQ